MDSLPHPGKLIWLWHCNQLLVLGSHFTFLLCKMRITWYLSGHAVLTIIIFVWHASYDPGTQKGLNYDALFQWLPPGRCQRHRAHQGHCCSPVLFGLPWKGNFHSWWMKHSDTPSPECHKVWRCVIRDQRREVRTREKEG